MDRMGQIFVDLKLPLVNFMCNLALIATANYLALTLSHPIFFTVLVIK